MAEANVQIEGLTKHFEQITAVEDLSLEIEEAEIFGLIGSDGAGKTTTLRLICGLLEPDEGSISVAGVSVSEAPEEARRRLGYLPQEFGLHRDLSIDENITYFADLFTQDLSGLSERRQELLEATELADFADRMAGDLSGGMKQKSALICALIHRPEVLLLDEPTRGVDPDSRRDLWRIIYGLPADGVTVIVATPDADEAERCDRLGVISAGSIVETAAPAEIIDRSVARILEIALDDRRRAQDMLRELEGLIAVSVVGRGVRVNIDADGPDVDDLTAMLEDEDHEVFEAEQVEPRLGDALLVLEERKMSEHVEHGEHERQR